MQEEDVERLPVIQARVIPLRRTKSKPPRTEWTDAPTHLPRTEELAEKARGGFFEEPTRTANPDELIAAREKAARETQSEVELRPRPRADATIQLDANDVEVLNPRRSRRVTPESLNAVDGGRRGSDLSRAAKEARARAHATGEIKVDAPEEKTTLAPDRMMSRLRGDSRKGDKKSPVPSELADASEDGQTRIHSPLGAWAGLAKLE